MAGRCVRGTELLLSVVVAGTLGREGAVYNFQGCRKRRQLSRGAFPAPGGEAGCLL